MGEGLKRAKRAALATQKRERKDCSVTVTFDSVEMRDAFFGWLEDGAMAIEFVPLLFDTLGAKSVDVDYEAPDRIIVIDPDVA